MMDRRGFLRLLGIGAGAVAAGGVTLVEMAKAAPAKVKGRFVPGPVHVIGNDPFTGIEVMTDRWEASPGDLELIPQDEFTRLSREFIHQAARAQDRRIMGLHADKRVTWGQLKQRFRGRDR